MIVILEDIVLFLFFIYIATVICDNLLSWQLLRLIDLGYINDVELFAASTELCKQIIERDISELMLDVLYRERGIQSFDAFLGI